MKLTSIISLYFVASFLSIDLSLAQNKGFSFQANIKNPAGAPVNATDLTINAKIFSPSGCILREEIFEKIKIENGYLALPITKGTPGGVDPGLSVQEIFNSSPVSLSGLTCFKTDGTSDKALTSYTPNPGDTRILRISTWIGTDNIVADFPLLAVPFAINSETLNGKTDSQFLQVNDAENTTQSNLESLLNRYTQLDALLNSFAGGSIASNVTGNASNVSGVVAVANGGTGANSAVEARDNLGIGTLATVNLPDPLNSSVMLKGDGTWGPITTGGSLNNELLGLSALGTNGYIRRDSEGSYSTTNASPFAGSDSLVQRDGSGVSSFFGVGIAGATGGLLTLQMPAVSDTYSLSFPAQQGGANQTLLNDGFGNLTWGSVPAAPAAACNPGQVLTYDGSEFTCVADQVDSSGGGGSLNNELTGLSLLSSNGLIQRTDTGVYSSATASPLASSNSLVQRDGSGVSAFNGINLSTLISSAVTLQPHAASETYSLTLPIIQGDAQQTLVNDGSGNLSWAALPPSPVAACTSTQVLTYNGTQFICVEDQVGTGGGGTLNAELTGLGLLNTNGFVRRTAAGAYSSVASSVTATADSLMMRDNNGGTSLHSLTLAGTSSGGVNLQSPSAGDDYSLTFPSAQGGANQVLKTDGSGNLSWANMPTTPESACAAGNVLTYDGSNFNCVPDQLGAAGAGISSFNGSSDSAQSLDIGTAGLTPNWSTLNGVHTLNIPMASATGVTAGLLSRSQYNTFNAKLGTSTSFTGDVIGTYNSLSVDKLQGTVLTLTALTSGNFLRYNGTAWVNSALSAADIPNHDANKITTGTLSVARGGTNSSTTLVNNRIMASSGGAIVEAPAITASRALVSNASGIPTHSAVTATELGYLSGVTSSLQTQLNSKISSGSFAIGTTGTAPNWTESSGTQTLHIPLASATGVTAGLISKNQYDTFTAKLGTTTALGGDISGTYNAVTVNKIKGQTVTLTSSTSGQFLKYNGTAWVNSALSAADVPNQDASKITTGTLPIARGGTNSSTTLVNNRIMASSGGAIVEAPAIAASRALISNANGIPTHSSVTSTELGYLDGVTSSVQTQLNSKLPAAGGTITGNLVVNGQVTIIGGTPGAGKVLTSNSSGVASWQEPPSAVPPGTLCGTRMVSCGYNNRYYDRVYYTGSWNLSEYVISDSAPCNGITLTTTCSTTIATPPACPTGYSGKRLPITVLGSDMIVWQLNCVKN